MSDSTNLPALDDILWTKATSEKGAPYEVGVLKTVSEEAPVKAAGEKKDDFSVYVDWPVGDSSWKNPGTNVQDVAAITRYKLFDNVGTFAYILYFTNTEHYDYHFKDKTNDVYRCNTFTNGDHFVRYNSSDPTIRQIYGD